MPNNIVEEPQPKAPESTSPNPVGKKPPFLVLFVGVLVLIAFFILLSPKIIQKYKVRVDIQPLSSQLLESGEDQPYVTSHNQALVSAFNSDDKGAQYKALFNLAQGVSADYSTNHNPKLREFLEKLDSYVLKNYPQQYQDVDFFVLCSDEGCGKLEYKPEILEIKNEAETADLGLYTKAVISALYNASLVSSGATLADKDREIDNLGYVLSVLHGEAQLGNESAKPLETKLLSYLEKTYPDFVSVWKTGVAKQEEGQR